MTGRHRMSWDRTQKVIILLLVLVVGYLLVSHVAARLEVNQSRQQAQAVADPVEQLCSQGGPVAEALNQRGACQKASEVQQAPSPPVEGHKGDPGRGITGTAIVDGHLRVSYTDGTTQDKGPVVGQPGAPGRPGRGIVGSTITDGHLVLAYSDGGSDDVGPIVGPQGETGANGTDGRGIRSVDGSTGRLVITYDDGTTEDAGPLPQGPKGDPGRGVQRAEVRDCRWFVLYTDGVEEDAGNACTTQTVTPAPTSTTTAPPRPLLPTP